MTFKTRHIAQACLLLLAAGGAIASSHREAPFITTAPKVDGTDFYMFRSYEPGKDTNTTLIANYLPLQDAYGGPNYFSLDPNALYEIHVDNNGDGKEDLTFQFKFKNELKNGTGITIPVGGQNVAIPLRNIGKVAAAQDANLSYNETFTLDVVRGDRRTGKREAVTGAAGATFQKPVDNIGSKTFTNYAAYAAPFVQTINIPGCDVPGKVFVGQRKEAFSVNLGVIFDLVNADPAFITSEANASAAFANGVGGDGKFGNLAYKNVTSLALEVPTRCLTQGTEKVIGGWTTASLRQGRLINGAPPSGLQTSEKAGGAWTQVSRLGSPLVNEVVIGLKDKDKFNASKPVDDAANFAVYVTNPTFPTILESLFGTTAPTNFPRKDLLTTFLTGIPGVKNRPSNYTGLGVGGPLAEMLRLNTDTLPTAASAQKSLGVIGGDSAGYPNGRRLGDDVVDITLRVAMGVLCVATGTSDAFGVGCKPADAPSGSTPFVDGVRAQGSDFQSVFPYLNTPLPGAGTN